jgi:hypothetical protein
MKVIFVGSIILFFGCSTNIKIVDTYGKIGNPDYFILKGDGTFIYKYNSFHVSKYSSGTWKKGVKNKIILNSTLKSKIIDLKGAERHSSNESYLTLDLEPSDTLGGKDYKCEVFLNDTLYGLSNLNQLVSTGLDKNEANNEININDIFFRYIRCDSLASTTLKFPIKSVYFKILKQPFYYFSTMFYNEQLVTNHYYLKSDETNVLKLTASFNDSLFQYKIFDNVDIIVKRNGIYYFEGTGKNKWWIPRLN